MDQLEGVFARAQAEIAAERKRSQEALENERLRLQSKHEEKAADLQSKHEARAAELERARAALKNEMADELNKRHCEWHWITHATGATSEEQPRKRPKTATPKYGGQGCPTAAPDAPEIVELNVGGRTFVTTRGTLMRDPDSMLAAMFSGRHPVGRGPDGRFFIDNDGAGFHVVLNYLRHGKLVVEDAELKFLKERLSRDAEFYCLPGLATELKSRINATMQEPPSFNATMQEPPGRGQFKVIQFFPGGAGVIPELENVFSANPKSRVLGFSTTAHGVATIYSCLIEVID